MAQPPNDFGAQLQQFFLRSTTPTVKKDSEGDHENGKAESAHESLEVAELKARLQKKHEECEKALIRYREVQDMLNSVLKSKSQLDKDAVEELLQSFYDRQEEQSNLERVKLESMQERTEKIQSQLDSALVRVKELEVQLEEATRNAQANRERKESVSETNNLKEEVERLHRELSHEISKKDEFKKAYLKETKDKESLQKFNTNLKAQLDIERKGISAMRKQLDKTVDGERFLEMVNNFKAVFQSEATRLSREYNMPSPFASAPIYSSVPTPPPGHQQQPLSLTPRSSASGYTSRPTARKQQEESGLEALWSATTFSQPMPEGNTKRKVSINDSSDSPSFRKKTKSLNLPPPPEPSERAPLHDVLWKPYFFGDDKSMCYYVVKQGDKFVWRSHQQLNLIAPIPERPMTGPRAKMPNLMAYASGRYPTRANEFMKT